MLRFLVVRLLNSLFVLFLSTVLIFFLVAAAADPLSELKEQQPPVPDNVIDAEKQRLGLDKPLLQRYMLWIAGVLLGDFGPSVNQTQNIGSELASRVAVTMRLVVLAIVIAAVLAILVGSLAGIKQNSISDFMFTSVGFLFLATPSFWLAIILKQVGIAINNAAGETVLYTVGEASVPPPENFWESVFDKAGHLVLPTLVLALVHFAAWNRYHRTSTIETLTSDHVRFSILKGLPRRRVIGAHVLRPSLIPIVTVVALDLPAIFSGTIITETVFQWRGMGQFLLTSISASDTNAVMAWLLVAAIAVVFFNFVADVLYAVLDPRVRYVSSK